MSSRGHSHTEPRVRVKPGTRIRDTFTVDRHLGSGRFADVYLVRHRYLGMQAMKLLVDAYEEDAGQEAFREAFLLSRITHPGIVRVYDANRTGLDECNQPYITMEFVDGGTLADVIGASPFGLRAKAALELALQIAHAVSHAHSQATPIVHRDIKPSNILIEKQGDRLRARVADFGLARAVDRFTECVAAAGTLLYTAPESLRGFETPASDVFSMGLVLHELLTGVLPFRQSALRECTTEAEVRAKLAELHAGPMPPPSESDPALGPDVDYLVDRMLTRTMEDRIQDAGEAALVIEACVESRRVAAEDWEQGEGRKAAEIAFHVARERGRDAEAVAWFRKAVSLQPGLRIRLEPFMDLLARGRELRRGGTSEVRCED